MMKNMSQLRVGRVVTLLISFAAIAAGFQNCSQVGFGKGKQAQATQSSTQLTGNGDSYVGKVGHYVFNDALKSCRQLAKDGTPFPNREIFYQGGYFALVRDDCQDIEPRVLAGSEVSVDAVTNTLVYQGQTFALNTDFSRYNLIAPTCPAGRAVINPNPLNLYSDPLDLAALSWVSVHPQIPARLDGSISALPRYLVEVTSSNPADWYDWMRVAQKPVLKPNTLYAVSFLLQRGSRPMAVFHYNEGGPVYATADIDLQNGTASINSVSGGLAAPTLTMRPYGNGYVFTMFVRSSPGVSDADTGVAPTRGIPGVMDVQPGDSIYATAGAFHEVDTYCAP